jgi:HlyD family secretion protein
MPNTSSAQDRLSQNNHHPSSQGLSEQCLDFTEPGTVLSTQSKSSESVADDWSSLTKELVDTLPRVWTRGLLYFLVVFAAIVLPWAALSKVDETGSARGRLEPQGKTLKLDAPVAGTVAAVKVKEGQTVKAGQILLELESELNRTELQQAQARLEGHQNRAGQLEQVKNQLAIAIRTQQLQSQAQASEQLAQLSQIRQRINSSQKVSAIEQERLAVTQNDVRRHQSLWQAGVVPKIKLEEVESVAFERQRLLEQAQSDSQQAQTELKKQQSAYNGVIRSGELAVLESQRQLKELQSQVSSIRSEITQTQKLIQSLQFQLQQRVLRAPMDGTIFQLSIDNAGTVLQPGQAITQVAPLGAPLVFRAQMPSQESGFLRLGMPVKLKFDAYPFQDYGVMPGRLRWISPDSKVVETAQGKVENFELEIVLAQTYIQTQNKRIALTPGQTATAEVIVRQRRIIDFVLDPFKKLQKGGLDL